MSFDVGHGIVVGEEVVPVQDGHLLVCSWSEVRRFRKGLVCC